MSAHLTITPCLADDLPQIEDMLDHAFGLDRQAKTSYRLREGNSPAEGLSLVVRDGGALVGAISFWPIRIGAAGHEALLLGPLVVHWQRQNQGIGLKLMLQGLALARTKGHRFVILVGDEPYYARAGFKKVPHGKFLMPGPVNEDRLLYLELEAGSLSQARGLVLPPYRYEEIYRPSRNQAAHTSSNAAASASNEENSG